MAHANKTGFTTREAEGSRSHRAMWMVVPLIALLLMIAAIYYLSSNGLGFY